jgi:hypothetical protein
VEAGADGRAGGGRGAGPASPGAGAVPDRAGRAAEAADQGRDRDRPGPGDDRAPGPGENTPSGNESGNVRNGAGRRRCDRGTGQLAIEVSREQDGTFVPTHWSRVVEGRRNRSRSDSVDAREFAGQISNINVAPIAKPRNATATISARTARIRNRAFRLLPRRVFSMSCTWARAIFGSPTEAGAS